jgi:hypothetical protein
MGLYVANDGILIMDELKSTCEQSDGRGKKSFKSVLILIPLRLGLDTLNTVYYDLLKVNTMIITGIFFFSSLC